eukprot:9310682-Alexandrium_andersonii.AAC.1
MPRPCSLPCLWRLYPLPTCRGCMPCPPWPARPFLPAHLPTNWPSPINYFCLKCLSCCLGRLALLTPLLPA